MKIKEGGVMDIQKERELFLAHMRSIGSARFMFELDEDGNFDDMSMAYAWSAWQAAKAQAVPEWISVKDNLPPENILVLGMSQTRSNIFNVYNVMALDEFEEAEVTHWMPLSDAPQEPDND